MLSKVKGHSGIKRLLINLVENERLGHAYLFAGPEGVGKAFTALQFFTFLSCPNARDGEPCGQCHVCQTMANLEFPDLHILGPGILPGHEHQRTIKIQEIRELGEFINYPPMQGPYKMVLINDAHLMTTEAANALLKVLEEPPSATLFILVSALDGRLPITIRSRCTGVWFGALEPGEIAQVLQEQGVSPDRAGMLGRVAGGSVRVALQLSEPEAWAFRQEALGHLLQGIHAQGLQRYAAARQLIEAVPKKWKNLLYTLLEYFAIDLLKVSMDPDARVVNEDFLDQIRQAASTERAVAFARGLLDLDRKQVYNVSLRAAMEGLLLGANR